MLVAGNSTGIPSIDWLNTDYTPPRIKAQIQWVEAEFTPNGAWPKNRSSIQSTGIMLARKKQALGERLDVIQAEYLYAMVLLRCLEKGVL